MPILLMCGHADCSKHTLVRKTTDAGRIHPPPSWWVIDGDGDEHPIVACCVEHLPADAQAKVATA
jgi:hypothetical protein